MTITKRNDRWYDENDNSWSTEESATRFSPTLNNCSSCSDCSWCRDCSNCSNCSCSHCGSCSNCSDCYDCSDCSNCRRCSDCSNCSDCYGCSDCSNCRGLKHSPYYKSHPNLLKEFSIKYPIQLYKAYLALEAKVN